MLRDLDPPYPTSTHFNLRCYACERPLALFRLATDRTYAHNLCSLCILYKKALPISSFFRKKFFHSGSIYLPFVVEDIIHSFVCPYDDLLHGGYQLQVQSIQKKVHRHVWSRTLLSGMRPLDNTYGARHMMFHPFENFEQTRNQLGSMFIFHNVVHTSTGPFGLAMPFVFHPNRFWGLLFTRSITLSQDWDLGLIPARPFERVCEFLGKPPFAPCTSLNKITWRWKWITLRLNSTAGLVPTPYAGPLCVILPLKSSYNKITCISLAAAIPLQVFCERLLPFIAVARIKATRLQAWRRIISQLSQPRTNFEHLPQYIKLQQSRNSHAFRQGNLAIQYTVYPVHLQPLALPRLKAWVWKRNNSLNYDAFLQLERRFLQIVPFLWIIRCSRTGLFALSFYDKIIPAPSSKLLDILIPYIFSLGTYGCARQRYIENCGRWSRLANLVVDLIHAPLHFRLPLYLFGDRWNQQDSLARCARLEFALASIGWRIEATHIDQLRLFARTWSALSILFREHPHQAVPRISKQAVAAYMSAACRELDHLLYQQIHGRICSSVAMINLARAWTHSDIPPWVSANEFQVLHI